jgi:Uma2 family endonuclease
LNLELKEKKKLKELLTYEIVNGKRIYYKGYKDALKGIVSPEAVMGASAFHSNLVMSIAHFLMSNLSKSYKVMGGELGYKIRGGWRNLDIAIFEYEKVKGKLESDEYIDVAPIVVIEINIRAEIEDEMEYISNKVNDLINSGVEKVIWIFTKPRVILIAQKNKDWVIKNWNEDIEVIEGLKLNLERLLREV